ncbi:hypothetical protein GCM10009530_39890 [Microbispora corallina]|uniref:Uncharacterized protein n=1 Tax=Microbispora corallina TaxID=83302 RepID=A0ABQ4G8V1_9ACTN|nr:hypothetical protein [Microbispora corallina]GIH43462.1 hypothetical protein Mco01_64620 [Microbispora corallina]
MSQAPDEGQGPPKKRKAPTGGRQDGNTRTKRRRLTREQEQEEVVADPDDPPTGPVRRSSRNLNRQGTSGYYATMESGQPTGGMVGILLGDQPPDDSSEEERPVELKKRKRKTPVEAKKLPPPPGQETEEGPDGDAHMSKEDEDSGSGDDGDWILLKPPAALQNLGDRPDIALVTSAAIDANEILSDYLYQAIQKIRASPIYTTLIADVSAVAPDSWKDLIAEHLQLSKGKLALTDVSLLQTIGEVGDSAGIVVVDGVGFPGLEEVYRETRAIAHYNTTLHCIHHGAVTAPKAPMPLKDGGAYWAYLKNVTFELCNAANRQKWRAINGAAERGALDCVSFCLAMETLESATEDRCDEHMLQVLAEPSFRTVLHEHDDHRQITLTAPADQKVVFLAGVGDRKSRLVNNLGSDHTLQYVMTWKDNYAKAYQAASPDLFAAFDAWTRGQGPAPVIQHHPVILKLIDMDVDEDEVREFQEYVQKCYQAAHMSGRDGENAADSTYVDEPRSGTAVKKKKQTQAKKPTKKDPQLRR